MHLRVELTFVSCLSKFVLSVLTYCGKISSRRKAKATLRWEHLPIFADGVNHAKMNNDLTLIDLTCTEF